MDLNELKKFLIKKLEEEIEEVTSNLLMEAEDEIGAEFTFTVGSKEFTFGMKTEYNEEKNEYTKEEYSLR